MKNANVFVDVDLTLVDANGKLLSGAREALQRLRDEGCQTPTTRRPYRLPPITERLIRNSARW